MKRLSDSEIGRLRAEYASGKVTHRELAALHGVSRSSVSRLLAGERRGTVEPVAGGPVAASVEAFLSGLELDAAGMVRASLTRAVAGKIDAAVASGTGTSALAVPRLVDGLAGLVDSLAGVSRTESAADIVARMLEPLAG